MATGKGLVLGELGLNQGEVLLTDQRRDLGDRNPFLRWHRRTAVVGMSNGVRRGAANARWTGTCAASVDLARVRGVAQDAAQRRQAPPDLPGWGADLLLMQAVRDLVETHARVEIGRKDGGDDRRLHGLDLHAGGITGVIGMQPVAVGRACPGQQHACP